MWLKNCQPRAMVIRFDKIWWYDFLRENQKLYNIFRRVLGWRTSPQKPKHRASLELLLHYVYGKGWVAVQGLIIIEWFCLYHRIWALFSLWITSFPIRLKSGRRFAYFVFSLKALYSPVSLKWHPHAEGLMSSSLIGWTINLAFVYMDRSWRKNAVLPFPTFELRLVGAVCRVACLPTYGQTAVGRSI